uniref:Uncharacterized protein n=1 Tax=Steinernema glaseri TaxID=37863 RepID=A0A1I7Y6L1_9BILA
MPLYFLFHWNYCKEVAFFGKFNNFICSRDSVVHFTHNMSSSKNAEQFALLERHLIRQYLACDTRMLNSASKYLLGTRGTSITVELL